MQNCIGAIDGTHIPITIAEDKAPHLGIGKEPSHRMSWLHVILIIISSMPVADGKVQLLTLECYKMLFKIISMSPKESFIWWMLVMRIHLISLHLIALCVRVYPDRQIDLLHELLKLTACSKPNRSLNRTEIFQTFGMKDHLRM